jgi:oxygen-independent coproporphyrinogen-3 oxidase
LADGGARADWETGGFGLYIHWPFCAAKCPYCDFNSHVAAAIDQPRWLRAYLAELRRGATATPGRTLRSVFFGGGTPSLMAPDTVAAIIAEIRRLWPVANDLEITLEANPTSVEAGRFAAYREGGISRVSIGIQALNDADLRKLGRMHSVREARAAYDTARHLFDRVSFDLIYARQDQSAAAWQAELTEALSMAADHLSLYQLTIEPGTAFGARHAAGGLRGLPDDVLAADMYEMTQMLCEVRGLPAYEVSNHAADGAESRHNLIYWRYGDYLGIGPGAHGRVTTPSGRLATYAAPLPGDWLSAVETAGSGEVSSDPLTADDQATEYLMMSLRLSEGSDLARLARLGRNVPQRTLDELSEMELVRQAGTRLTATPSGRMVLNSVLRALLLD